MEVLGCDTCHLLCPLLRDDKDEVSYYHRHKFDKEYDSIIKTAYKENPLLETPAKKCGRKKKAKY